MRHWRNAKLFKPKEFTVIIWKNNGGLQGEGFYTKDKTWCNANNQVMTDITHWKPVKSEIEKPDWTEASE